MERFQKGNRNLYLPRSQPDQRERCRSLLVQYDSRVTHCRKILQFRNFQSAILPKISSMKMHSILSPGKGFYVIIICHHQHDMLNIMEGELVCSSRGKVWEEVGLGWGYGAAALP